MQISYPFPICEQLKNSSDELKAIHLRELLKNHERNQKLQILYKNLLFDYSHELVDEKTIQLFEQLVKESNLMTKIHDMFNGAKINKTENRAVLHTALRAGKDRQVVVDGVDQIPLIHKVLEDIKNFTNKINDGTLKGFSGQNIENYIVIGIGGSYLAIEFVYEALRSHPDIKKLCSGRKLKFLANVDPIDLDRALEGIDLEKALFVINSKTFTTAETMLNARSCKRKLIDFYKQKGVQADTEEQQNSIVNSHMCACSTSLELTKKFGISDDRVFGFWDYVGGRYSVWSAIGMLPLSLIFGFDNMEQFLKGGNDIDQHLLNTSDLTQNIPLLVGLLGFYNTTILDFNARAILPYCQALSKFAPHIQQLDMESNGKRVSIEGEELKYQTGVVNFGEPGTNGQHSFYQLLHQGRVIPCEFIGFCKSQQHLSFPDEKVSNHDELMSNFFSQPDALACGLTIEQLKSQNVPENLIPHKYFPGNRPSFSLLFQELTPFSCGQLLALYEHRTIIEGFLWNVNSFDQFGVELGKVLATNVRSFFINKDKEGGFGLNSSTQNQLEFYCQNK